MSQIKLHKYTGVISGKGIETKELTTEATDRSSAVIKLRLKFIDFLKSKKIKVKTLRGILVVDDPGGEVQYDEGMVCSSYAFNYLSKEIAEKLVADSNGAVVLNPEPLTGYQFKKALGVLSYYMLAKARKLAGATAPASTGDTQSSQIENGSVTVESQTKTVTFSVTPPARTKEASTVWGNSKIEIVPRGRTYVSERGFHDDKAHRCAQQSTAARMFITF